MIRQPADERWARAIEILLKAAEIPQMMPVDAVAARLGVSGWTVRTWLRQGRIPFVKIGRRVLIKTTDVEALVVNNYKPAMR